MDPMVPGCLTSVKTIEAAQRDSGESRCGDVCAARERQVARTPDGDFGDRQRFQGGCGIAKGSMPTEAAGGVRRNSDGQRRLPQNQANRNGFSSHQIGSKSDHFENVNGAQYYAGTEVRKQEIIIG